MFSCLSMVNIVSIFHNFDLPAISIHRYLLFSYTKFTIISCMLDILIFSVLYIGQPLCWNGRNRSWIFLNKVVLSPPSNIHAARHCLCSAPWILIKFNRNYTHNYASKILYYIWENPCHCVYISRSVRIYV